eukprot:4937566-Pyramimonas_sp.AAC.1
MNFSFSRVNSLRTSHVRVERSYGASTLCHAQGSAESCRPRQHARFCAHLLLESNCGAFGFPSSVPAGSAQFAHVEPNARRMRCQGCVA